MTENAFFRDLAMLMSLAGVAAIVFSRLRWPKVLGYILAGVVLSEHTWGGSLLADVGSTRTIGQLGIVFLMFAMGLSFSPREMKRIRSVAVPSAVVDTTVMAWLGYMVGTRILGWPPKLAVFLGVAICDSATTLLAKVLDETGWGRRPFARCVIGTSVMEDILCVGAIALATGFATGGTVSAGAFLGSMAGFGVFLLVTLVFGFILVPRLLKSAARRGDDEVLVLTVLGCCFFVSYFAHAFNYSLAIGAFLVGVMGGSSDVRDRIERLVGPLKSMFAAVFFVSVGLLVDPAAFVRHLPEILLVSITVIAGKAVCNFTASVAAGLDVKTAVQNGFALAQIGEFAFMVAVLHAGIAGDSSTPLFPVAVGVSLLTTAVSPWMIRVSDAAGDFLERSLSPKMRANLAAYRDWLEKIRASESSPAFAHLRMTVVKLGVYAVLMLSVSGFMAFLHTFDYSRFSVFFERHDTVFLFLGANLFAMSLMPLVWSSARDFGDDVADLLVGEDAGKKWSQPMRQAVRFFSVCGVAALFGFEWLMIDTALMPIHGWKLLLTIAVFIAAGVLAWKYLLHAGMRATDRFREALTAEERREGLERMRMPPIPEGSLHRFTLESKSPAVGASVVTLDIRAKTGAVVVAVERAGELRRNVGPDLEFAVGDTLVAMGEPHQIAALKDLLGVV